MGARVLINETRYNMEADEVIRLESNWKERLHTRQPYGLNDN
jgi:hypothetical protein